MCEFRFWWSAVSVPVSGLLLRYSFSDSDSSSSSSSEFCDRSMISVCFPAMSSAVVVVDLSADGRGEFGDDDFQVLGSSLNRSSLNHVAGCGVNWSASPFLASAYALVFSRSVL